MPGTCINPPTGIIQPPSTVRGISTVSQSYPPFTLYGSPLPPIIQGIPGITIQKRKASTVTNPIPTTIGLTSTGSINQADLTAYLADQNYENHILRSKTIIDTFKDTSLRFKNETYDLLFISLNKPLWRSSTDNDSINQINLLFRSDNKDFFHICIPIQNYTNPLHKNPFLSSWLTGTAVSPNGLTLNDLLNFRGGHETAVEFNLMEFCLDYNLSGLATGIKPQYKTAKITSNYNLCVFETPLYADLSTISNVYSGAVHPTFDEAVFNNVFNLILKDEIKYYSPTIVQVIDNHLISAESHFGNATQAQNSITPAFFNVKTNLLSGTAYTSDQLKEGKRGLQNVKCYPIDLANQIDDGGNIYIDENNNTPEDPRTVLRDSTYAGDPNRSGEIDPEISTGQTSIKRRNRNIAIFIILTVLLAILVFIIAGYIASFVLKPSDLNAPVPVPPTAPAAAALAVAATVATAAAATAPLASVATVAGAAGHPNTSNQNRTRQNAMSPTNAATVGIIAALASSSPT